MLVDRQQHLKRALRIVEDGLQALPAKVGAVAGTEAAAVAAELIEAELDALRTAWDIAE